MYFIKMFTPVLFKRHNILYYYTRVMHLYRTLFAFGLILINVLPVHNNTITFSISNRDNDKDAIDLYEILNVYIDLKNIIYRVLHKVIDEKKTQDTEGGAWNSLGNIFGSIMYRRTFAFKGIAASLYLY